MAQNEDDDWNRLLQQARRGNPSAGKTMVERLYPTVIRIVRNHRPFAMDEEDLAQEVFMKMFAKLDTYRGLQPIEHWVSRIARNTCYDHLRKQQRRGELRYADLREEDSHVLEAMLSKAAESDSMLDTPEGVRNLLNQLLATLRPGEQQVLRMLDLEEMPVKEIAQQLNWGESKVKVTAFRARKKLRATLEKLEPQLQYEK
ncbi:MAG: RNA polymerase sigma factor [Verrucomicrobiota bacterium]